MAVIIKNIEMPKNCDCCHFLHRIEQDDDHPTFYICQIESIGKPITHIPMSSIDINKRQDWCPLVPIPPHGRLIDADALMKDGWKLFKQVGSSVHEMPLNNPSIPIIIEAEAEYAVR